VIGGEVDEVSYELSLGLPSVGSTDPFVLDPEVKEEAIWTGPKRARAAMIADRGGYDGPPARRRGASGLLPGHSRQGRAVLSQIGDPGRYPVVFALRNHLGKWRFYHEFPTGSEAPARSQQVGVRTTVLANDGRDLAAAITTIFQVGDGLCLRSAVDHAFPGSHLDLRSTTALTASCSTSPGCAGPLFRKSKRQH
jgi:predicted ATPase